MKNNQLSRRDFLKSSAAGALGLTLMGVSGHAAASEETTEGTNVTLATVAGKSTSISWSEAADVVIVGGGGAGFCAAIEAGRAGSSVLILEKSGIVGGDTNLSNGMLMAAGTDLQKTLADCDTDTPEAFAEQQVVYA